MNKTGSVGEARFAQEFETSNLRYFGSFGVRNLQDSELRNCATSDVTNFGSGGER
jgi:hypothetical protein